MELLYSKGYKMTIYTDIRKTKKGVKKTLWINFTHNNKRYRRSLKLEDTKANRKLAETKLLPEIQYKLNSGEFFNNTKVPTLDEFSQVSFDMHSSERSITTQKDYMGAYNLHIKPILGHYKLNAFKSSTLQSWQNELLEKISASRIKTLRTLLNRIFQDALNDEIIDKNPLSNIKSPNTTPKKIIPFSLQEVSNILSKASGQYKNFYALAFFTGMRSGEMIGLKWDDVDFEHNEINISRSIKMGETNTTKTNNSIRTVDIVDALLPYLKLQHEITGHHKTYVFLNHKQTHFYDIKRIRETHWEKTLESCNLEYRPIYHTRHTFATMMLENNEDILWVSSMLGHKDTTTTLKHYAKYINRKDKKRAEYLNNI